VGLADGETVGAEVDTNEVTCSSGTADDAGAARAARSTLIL